MVKIFVGRLPENYEKDKLEEMFKKFGEVVDCEVLKTYAFVHMAENEDAQKAIEELDQSVLDGNKINVEISSTKVASAVKIFVGNIPENTKSHEIHKLFKEYGTVIECAVIKDFAFVHMAREAMANKAIKGLNGSEFKDKKIRVQLARTSDNSTRQQRGNGRGGGWGNRGGGFGGPYNPMFQMNRFRPPMMDRRMMRGQRGFGMRGMRMRGGPGYGPMMGNRFNQMNFASDDFGDFVEYDNYGTSYNNYGGGGAGNYYDYGY